MDFEKARASQAGEKLWFWVAQRFQRCDNRIPIITRFSA